MARARRDPATFEQRRREILDASARVFAARGFAGARVGDIAREAGIAYGLIYHYFENKDAILEALFEENWGLSVHVVGNIGKQDGGLDDKLRAVAGFFLEAWRLRPELVEVVLLEVLRSPRMLESGHLNRLRTLFDALAEIFEAHRGELRPGVDPRLGAFFFLGSLELLLTGFVARELLGGIVEPDQRHRDALVDTFARGLLR